MFFKRIFRRHNVCFLRCREYEIRYKIKATYKVYKPLKPAGNKKWNINIFQKVCENNDETKNVSTFNRQSNMKRIIKKFLPFKQNGTNNQICLYPCINGVLVRECVLCN